MKDIPDITPCLSLTDVIKSVEGIVLVRRPSIGLLKKLNLYEFDSRKKILLLFENRSRALKVKRRIMEDRLKNFDVLQGDIPVFYPLKRRSVSAIITSLPYVEESEKLRFLRKAAGMLVDEGLLVLHARMRGRILGVGEHVGRVLFSDGSGLPDEFTLLSLTLRGGFSRVEKRRLGRLQRRTFFLARKNTL